MFLNLTVTFFSLQHQEAKKVIRNFNKMAGVLLEYEMLYHRGWCRAVEAAKSGLNAALLVRHPESGELFVNCDNQIQVGRFLGY